MYDHEGWCTSRSWAPAAAASAIERKVVFTVEATTRHRPARIDDQPVLRLLGAIPGGLELLVQPARDVDGGRHPQSSRSRSAR